MTLAAGMQRVLESPVEQGVQPVDVLVEHVHHRQGHGRRAFEAAKLGEGFHRGEHLDADVREAGGRSEKRQGLGMKGFRVREIAIEDFEEPGDASWVYRFEDQKAALLQDPVRLDKKGLQHRRRQMLGHLRRENAPTEAASIDFRN